MTNHYPSYLSSDLGVPWNILTFLYVDSQQDYSWHKNCAENVTAQVRDIEQMDTGSNYDPKYVNFLAERIVCAQRETDRGSSTGEKAAESYTSMYQYLKGELWSDVQDEHKLSDDETFLEYLLHLAESYTNMGYKPVGDALITLAERTRAKWGYQYEDRFSSEAQKDPIVNSINENIQLVSKYNRKAKTVGFFRPQFSRRNLRTVGISVAVLITSVMIYKRLS